MAGDVDKLTVEVSRLDRITAHQANLINKLLHRRVTGIGVTEVADGWHVNSILGAGDSFKLCVIRTLDLVVSPQLMEAQAIAYNEDPLQPGESYKHIVAVGENFEVFPPPTWTYEMYQVEGASPKPFIEDENLISIVPWWVDNRNFIYPTLKFAPSGMVMIDPAEATQGAGGI